MTAGWRGVPIGAQWLGPISRELHLPSPPGARHSRSGPRQWPGERDRGTPRNRRGSFLRLANDDVRDLTRIRYPNLLSSPTGNGPTRGGRVPRGSAAWERVTPAPTRRVAPARRSVHDRPGAMVRYDPAHGSARDAHRA